MLTIESFEKIFLEQKRRVERLTDLSNLLKKHPEVLDDLAGLLAARNTEIVTTSAKVGRPARSGTAYQRIAGTFIRHDNEWLDTGAISRESNVSRNAVASVLWSLHKDDFQKMDHATHKRMKVWRMTPERFDILKKQPHLFGGKSDPSPQDRPITTQTDAFGRRRKKRDLLFSGVDTGSNGKEEK